MKMTIKTVNGGQFNIGGDIVNIIQGKMIKKNKKDHNIPPLGWIVCGNQAINFDHVVYLEFEEELLQ